MNTETIEPTERLLDTFRAAVNVEIPNIELVPPTSAMAAKITALFEGDGDVFTIFNYEKSQMKIFVKGIEKADAINLLINHKFKFGEQTLTITIVSVAENGKVEELEPPDYDLSLEGMFNLFQIAFKGNPYVKGYQKIHDPFFSCDYYIILTSREACRIKDDNASSPKGYTCELACDIMKEIFDIPGYILPSTLCW